MGVNGQDKKKTADGMEQLGWGWDRGVRDCSVAPRLKLIELQVAVIPEALVGGSGVGANPPALRSSPILINAPFTNARECV